MVQGFESHGHEGLLHNHQHIHVTHHAKGGTGGELEHLSAVHTHDHNHSKFDHAHGAHQDQGKEHEHEAHIHDHAHPTES